MTWKGPQCLKVLFLLTWLSLTGYTSLYTNAESVGINEDQDDVLDLDKVSSTPSPKLESDVHQNSIRIEDNSTISDFGNTDEVKNDTDEKDFLHMKDEEDEGKIEDGVEESILPDLSNVNKGAHDDSLQESVLSLEQESPSLPQSESIESIDTTTVEVEPKTDLAPEEESDDMVVTHDKDILTPSQQEFNQLDDVSDNSLPGADQKAAYIEDNNINEQIAPLDMERIENDQVDFIDMTGTEEADIEEMDASENMDYATKEGIEKDQEVSIKSNDEMYQEKNLNGNERVEDVVSDNDRIAVEAVKAEVEGKEEQKETITKSDPKEDEEISLPNSYDAKRSINEQKETMIQSKIIEDTHGDDYDTGISGDANNYASGPNSEIDHANMIKSDQKEEDVTDNVKLNDTKQIPDNGSTTGAHLITETLTEEREKKLNEIPSEDQVEKDFEKIDNQKSTQIHTEPVEIKDEKSAQESTPDYVKNSYPYNEEGNKGYDSHENSKEKLGTEPVTPNLVNGRQQAATTQSYKDQNIQFVEGLTDIDKFLEEVDPPDELDVGAAGSSIQEVLMSQGVQIIKTRLSKGVQYVRRKVIKPIKDRVSSTLNRHNDEYETDYVDYEIDEYQIINDEFFDDEDDTQKFSLNMRPVKEALNITRISNGVLQLVERNKGRIQRIQKFFRRIVHQVQSILDDLGFLGGEDYDEYDGEFTVGDENVQSNENELNFESLNLDQMRQRVMQARGTPMYTRDDENQPKSNSLLNRSYGSKPEENKPRQISDELQNMLKSRYQAKMKEREELKVTPENET